MLALFGVFGPAIASGLVAGAPQLGAGSVVGTAALAGGAIVMGGAGAVGAMRGLAGAGLGAIRAGTTMGSAASTAYKLGQETSGSTSVRAGLGGMATAAKDAAANRMRGALGIREAAERGQQATWNAGSTGTAAAGASAASTGGAPAWAQKLQASQTARHRRQMAVHAIQSGDKGGAGANPDIKERD